jgi:hypothetical protein
MPSAQSDDQAGHILADVLSGTQKAAHGTRQAVLGALSALFSLWWFRSPILFPGQASLSLGFVFITVPFTPFMNAIGRPAELSDQHDGKLPILLQTKEVAVCQLREQQAPSRDWANPTVNDRSPNR